MLAYSGWVYSIILMGNELCNGAPEEELQRIDYNPDEQHVDEQINRIIRNGLPSEFVAYNINALPADLKEAGKLSELQERIAKLMNHEKRHHRALVIANKKANDNNYLPDPYYIRSMKAVYIGEWVLDKDCNQVVPGGLGRLYCEDRIIEGEILTKAHTGLVFFDENSVAAAQPAFTHNKQKAKFFAATTVETTTAKIDILGLVGTSNNDEFLRMEVMLHGEGRSFTRTSEESGIFKDGLLEGKGQSRIKEGQDVYEYTGEFKKGKKHGKGLEKFKLTTYDGDFEEDRKKGKGVLTLLISRAYDEERLQQDAKLTILDKERDPSDKVKRVKEFIRLRQTFQGKLAQALKEFKWIPPVYPPKSLLDNENFVIDHHRRKKFLENYKGDFDRDQFNGTGTYQWFNGKCYSGQWKNGKMDGVGEFYWPKGTFYRGEYEKDLRHGKGEMIWSFDKRFRGSWAYGLRHGYGEFIEIETVPSIDPDQKEPSYFLRVKGALFDQDQIKKEYFNTRRQIDGLELQNLKLKEKLMIAFVKDIKIDQAAFK